MTTAICAAAVVLVLEGFQTFEQLAKVYIGLMK